VSPAPQGAVNTGARGKAGPEPVSPESKGRAGREIRMKVFVSTPESQGERGNDFCHVPEGELVNLPHMTCDGERVDGRCGCKRSVVGLDCHFATTTFKVVEKDMTVFDLAKAIEKSLVSSGWAKLMGPERVTASALEDARELNRLAKKYRPGTVLEFRGSFIRARTIPPSLIAVATAEKPTTQFHPAIPTGEKN